MLEHPLWLILVRRNLAHQFLTHASLESLQVRCRIAGIEGGAGKAGEDGGGVHGREPSVPALTILVLAVKHRKEAYR